MEALIFDGEVLQIEAVQFPVAPTFIWVDITGVTPVPKVGWLYDGTVFSAPPVVAPLTTDQIYVQTIKNQRVLKALVLALNDGSVVPGANATNATLKTAIKAKM